MGARLGRESPESGSIRHWAKARKSPAADPSRRLLIISRPKSRRVWEPGVRRVQLERMGPNERSSTNPNAESSRWNLSSTLQRSHGIAGALEGRKGFLKRAGISVAAFGRDEQLARAK